MFARLRLLGFPPISPFNRQTRETNVSFQGRNFFLLVGRGPFLFFVWLLSFICLGVGSVWPKRDGFSLETPKKEMQGTRPMVTFFAGAPVGASPSSQTQLRVLTPQKARPWVPPKGTQARSAKVHGLRGGGGALREWPGGGFGAAGPRGPRLHAGLPRHEDQRGDREGRGLPRGVRKGRV